MQKKKPIRLLTGAIALTVLAASVFATTAFAANATSANSNLRRQVSQPPLTQTPMRHQVLLQIPSTVRTSKTLLRPKTRPGIMQGKLLKPLPLPQKPQ
jgi:hypothetical protein